jgi:hypothetical protein
MTKQKRLNRKKADVIAINQTNQTAVAKAIKSVKESRLTDEGLKQGAIKTLVDVQDRINDLLMEFDGPEPLTTESVIDNSDYNQAYTALYKSNLEVTPLLPVAALVLTREITMMWLAGLRKALTLMRRDNYPTTAHYAALEKQVAGGDNVLMSILRDDLDALPIDFTDHNNPLVVMTQALRVTLHDAGLDCDHQTMVGCLRFAYMMCGLASVHISTGDRFLLHATQGVIPYTVEAMEATLSRNFDDDPRLTDHETQILRMYVDAGAPAPANA